MRRFIFLPLALFPVTNGAAAATAAVERGGALPVSFSPAFRPKAPSDPPPARGPAPSDSPN
jgi:hypothetical protein